MTKRRFWHGTYVGYFRRGDLIEPGHAPNFAPRPEGQVYMTGTPEGAWQWVEDVVSMPHDAGIPRSPHVYEVEPTGRYERDPKGEIPGESGDHRSRYPLRVVGWVRWMDGMEDRQQQGASDPPGSDREL